MTVDPYEALTDTELFKEPIAYRDDLFAGQVAVVTGGAGGSFVAYFLANRQAAVRLNKL